MIDTLSSRERMLCAMRRGQADHVPLWNLWRSRNLPFQYVNQVERAEAVLRLGLDDTLLLQPPLNKAEHYAADRAGGVSTRVWQESIPGERYPRLVKEYTTPAGPIRQVVQMTEDWPYFTPQGSPEVRLFSDHNVSRALEFPVKGEADLAALSCLLCDPSPAQVTEFREEAARLRREADRLGVVLEGGWTALGDCALWLLGTEALLYLQMDQPGLVEALLDTVLRWELRREALLLEAGVEVIVHSAWYETTNFWSPRTYRRMIKPRLQQLIDQAHQAGALFSYIITSAWQPLAADILETGIDSLIGIDPVQDKVDLTAVKQRLGGKICLWGGINGALTLGHAAPAEVARATQEAIETLAPGGGFVLYPVDQLVKETPWENVEAMIASWRKYGYYESQVWR